MEAERHDDMPSEADDSWYAYVVKRIPTHTDGNEGSESLVRWYGYSAANDT